MIEALRHDDIIEKFGGRFKLCSIIQKRWLQLLQGARPMVETKGLTDMEVIIKEIVEGKLELIVPQEGEKIESPFDKL